MWTQARLNSTNFLTDIITAALYVVAGGALVNVSFDVDATILAVIEQNWGYLASVSIPALIQFATKVIQNIKEGSFKLANIFKSPNAVTRLLVVFGGLMATLNVVLPTDMPQVLSDAIFNGGLAAVVTAVIATIVNPIYHIWKDRRDDSNL